MNRTESDNHARRHVDHSGFIVESFTHERRALVPPAPPCWDDLDEDRRAALASLVREALIRLAENPDDWLPLAAVATSNTSIGITISWENGHLADEVLAMHARAEDDLRRRLDELKALAGPTPEPPT